MRTRYGITLLALLVLSGSLVSAEVYQWEDDQGGVHFTDNAEKIPAKYRQKVRQRESIRGTESVAKPAAEGQEVKQAAPSQPVPVPRDDDQLSSQWTRRLNVMKQELATAQKELAEKREALQRAHRAYILSLDTSRLKKDPEDKTPPSYALNTIGAKRKAYHDLQEEVATAEARVKEQEEKLAALQKEAANAGVSNK